MRGGGRTTKQGTQRLRPAFWGLFSHATVIAQVANEGLMKKMFNPNINLFLVTNLFLSLSAY